MSGCDDLVFGKVRSKLSRGLVLLCDRFWCAGGGSPDFDIRDPLTPGFIIGEEFIEDGGIEKGGPLEFNEPPPPRSREAPLSSVISPLSERKFAPKAKENNGGRNELFPCIIELDELGGCNGFLEL